MNKKQTIELIEQQLPGFYSPDQVINIIKDIEEESTPVLSKDKREEFVQDIYQELENLGLDIFEDYELSMSYKEVELDDITLADTRIERAIREVVERYLTEEENN